jgi:hypothetical protein
VLRTEDESMGGDASGSAAFGTEFLPATSGLMVFDCHT